MIEKINVQLTVLQGEGLVAKDRNLFGKKTSSDPYVEVWSLGQRIVGKTKTHYKTLSPTWNQTFSIDFREEQAPFVDLKIWDEDRLSSPDAMGTVTIQIPTKTGDTTQWVDVPPESAKKASGKLQVRLQTTIFQSRSLVRGNGFELESACNHIRVGLAWDPVRLKYIDLDVSCVAISHQGRVAMDDTVYYGNIANSNQSVAHSGDEQSGEEVGDDESISLQLDRVPSHVLAMYIILTVATPNMTISDVQSTRMTIYDTAQETTLCSFEPARHALSEGATAMFMVRIARAETYSTLWVVSPIEDTHPTARDFGSVIPYLKSYTRDLLPSIQVDPTERVAILRKGGNVRLTDYIKGGKLPNKLTFGLAWDVTDGVNIDLDASAICFDKSLNLVDKVWFVQLQAKDGSIVHHGDEQVGDTIGDDEKMDIYLDRVDPLINYIGFVINSYSGQELDDVDHAACHLFDPQTNVDIASYALTNSQSLDGFTALVVGCLYRETSQGEWGLCIISEVGQGKTVKENVEMLQNYLRRYPPQVPEEEEIIVMFSEMPSHVPLVDEDIDLSAEIDLPAPVR